MYIKFSNYKKIWYSFYQLKKSITFAPVLGRLAQLV